MPVTRFVLPNFGNDRAIDVHPSMAASDLKIDGTPNANSIYGYIIGGDDYPDSTATTWVVGVGGSITGTIESTGDHDWFRVTLTAGQLYQFDLEASATGQGTLPNPFLELLSSTGSSIAFDFDSGTGNNARITYTPSSS